MNAVRLMLFGVIAAGIIAAGVYGTLSGGPQPTTSATTSVSTCTSRSSTSAGQPTVVNGSFTYSPQVPIQIVSVQALIYPDQGNLSSVVFRVFYLNDGNSTFYVYGACGSPLASSIASGNAIERDDSALRCLCASAIVQVPPSQAGSAPYSAVDPGCWSGYRYLLATSGRVTVNITFTWSAAGAGPYNGTATNIAAAFTMPPV